MQPWSIWIFVSLGNHGESLLHCFVNISTLQRFPELVRLHMGDALDPIMLTSLWQELMQVACSGL